MIEAILAVLPETRVRFFWACVATAVGYVPLLVGEGADPATVEVIRNLVEATPTVSRMNEIRTLHRGPQDVLLALSIDFENNLTVGSVEESIYALEVAIKRRFPIVRRVFIEAQATRHHMEMLEADRRHDDPPAS